MTGRINTVPATTPVMEAKMQGALATDAGAMNPLCFVLMPFGRKPAASGSIVDFDVVYADLIAPGVDLSID